MRVLVDIDMDRFEAGFIKLEQLEALLASTSGQGFAPFMALASNLQDHLIMLAADLAHEARICLTIME